MAKVGNKYDFYHNAVINCENVTVISEVGKIHDNDIQKYIIENENGWNPDPIKQKVYLLDANKKYLFVTAAELHEPGAIKKMLSPKPAGPIKKIIEKITGKKKAK